MPIYEYRCPNGHTFEVFQRMSDPPASVCETCGAGPVEKVLFHRLWPRLAQVVGEGRRLGLGVHGRFHEAGQAGRDIRGEEVGLPEVRYVGLNRRQGTRERTAGRAAAGAEPTGP